MQIFLKAVALSLFAAPVAAQTWDCQMVTECLDTEACAETSYELSLGALEGGFLLSDIAGERPMSEVEVLDEPDQRAFVSKVQNLSVGLLSLYPDMRAHYTVHAPDYALRYAGTCKERG